jgi:hypothetical protein
MTDSGTVRTMSSNVRFAAGISYSWTLGRREERVHRRVVDRLETTSLVLGGHGPEARSRRSSPTPS